MKRIIALILAFALSLSLMSCGGSSTPAQQEGVTKEETSSVSSETEFEEVTDDTPANELKDDTGISESYSIAGDGKTLIGRFKNELDYDVHLTVDFTLTDDNVDEFLYGYVEQPCLRAGEEYIAILSEQEPFADYYTDISVDSVDAQDTALYDGVDIQSQANDDKSVNVLIYSDSEYNAIVSAFFFDSADEIIGYDYLQIGAGGDEGEPFDFTFDCPAGAEDYASYKIIFSLFD